MFDSDEDDFQKQRGPMQLQRLLQKKQKKTQATMQSKRRLSCAPHSPPKRQHRLQSSQLVASASDSEQHGTYSNPGFAAVDPHLPYEPSGRQVQAASGRLHSTETENPAEGSTVWDARQQHHAFITTRREEVAIPAVTDPPGADCFGNGQLQSAQPQKAGQLAASQVPAVHCSSEQHNAQDACPVCRTLFSVITTSEAGKAVHVNACLDSAATVVRNADPTAAAAAARAEQQGAEEMEDSDLADWLSSIGASAVLDLFAAADIDLSVLPHLNDHDLQGMGIEDGTLRQKILTAASAQQPSAITAVPSEALDGPHGSGQQQQQHHTQPVPHSQYVMDGDNDGHDDGQGWDDCHEDDWEHDSFHNENMLLAEGWGARAGYLATAAACATVSGTTTAATEVHVNCSLPDSISQQQQRQRQQRLQSPLRAIQQPILMNVVQQHGSGTAGQQHSIAADLQHQQSNRVHGQQPQHGKGSNLKQQWQALFSKPGRVLAPPQPLPTLQSCPQQRLLDLQGHILPGSRQCGGRLKRIQQQEQQEQALLRHQHGECTIISRGRTVDLPRWWAAWRRLPGTNIVVDCFGQSSKSIGTQRTWILTHFHADHYMGLSKNFKQGRILCTPITAALVKLKLRVPEQVLVPLELGKEVIVEGTRVQFVDANHCPGAAMVIAYPPGGLPPVLHTGDARLTAQATQQQPVLQALVGKAVVVLDTTYANPTYCFPPQRDVLDWVLKAVKAESFNPRTLFLFGSYTIGKERLFLHVASALKAKVYVAAAKRAVLGAINLAPEQAALLTTNHLESNIHVVPMRQVSLSEMESLLVRYKGRYTAVVGFQPTGWAQGGAGSKSGEPSRSSSSVRPSKRLQRGTVVLYKVPYSEHSSCAELREFVKWFKPLQIIPSVSNDNGPKLKQMMTAITHSGKTTGPIDAWAQRQQ